MEQLEQKLTSINAGILIHAEQVNRHSPGKIKLSKKSEIFGTMTG